MFPLKSMIDDIVKLSSSPPKKQYSEYLSKKS